MDFLGFLRDLFGGGQKPAAPSTPQPPPMLRRPPEQQAAPAPVNFQASPMSGLSFMAAPAQRPAQQQNTGPFRPIHFSPPPANAPEPLNLQGPLPDGFSVTRGQADAKKLVEKRAETKKAEDAQSAYFGGEGEYVPEQMSVDAYLTLSPQQRAAVDANTALVQAAEQDVASWAKQQVAGKPIEDKTYLDQVKGKFGDKGGSDTYAPRTMAVLEDLGLNLQGKDLDQYLNRSALVTAEDLSLLSPDLKVTSPRQENAVAFAQAASNRLSETLASGQTLLDSIRTGSDTGRQLFGEPATPPLSGALKEELDQAFDIFAQARSQQDLTPETVGNVYAELQQKHGVTPNEVAQYFETRLQANEYLGASEGQPVPLGEPNSKLEYLAPADFRSKFLMRGA